MQSFFNQNYWKQSNYCNNLGLMPNPNFVQGNVWGGCTASVSSPMDSMFNMMLQMRRFDLMQNQMELNLLLSEAQYSNSNYDFDFSTSITRRSRGSSRRKKVYDPKEEDYMLKSDPNRAEKLQDVWSDIAKKRGLSAEFFEKVVDISDNIGCYPEDLLAVMNSESGLNPKKVNSHGGATGLIQFMPDTARGMGTTTSAIKRMSALEQLDLVEEYYLKSIGSSKLRDKDHITGADLYAITFLPAYADRNVLARQGHKYYNQNAGLDIDKDGDIDKKDLAHRVAEKGRWVT